METCLGQPKEITSAPRFVDLRRVSWSEKEELGARPLSDLQPVLTEYFSQAHRHDLIDLGRVEADGVTIAGFWNVREFAPRTADNPAFHLTIVNATSLVTQLAVAHGLLTLGRSFRESTVLQAEFQIRCRFPVKEKEGIEVRLEMVKASPKRLKKAPLVPGTLFRWKFSIAGGAFMGETAIVFVEQPGVMAKV